MSLRHVEHMSCHRSAERGKNDARSRATKQALFAPHFARNRNQRRPLVGLLQVHLHLARLEVERLRNDREHDASRQATDEVGRVVSLNRPGVLQRRSESWSDVHDAGNEACLTHEHRGEPGEESCAPQLPENDTRWHFLLSSPVHGMVGGHQEQTPGGGRSDHASNRASLAFDPLIDAELDGADLREHHGKERRILRGVQPCRWKSERGKNLTARSGLHLDFDVFRNGNHQSSCASCNATAGEVKREPLRQIHSSSERLREENNLEERPKRNGLVSIRMLLEKTLALP